MPETVVIRRRTLVLFMGALAASVTGAALTASTLAQAPSRRPAIIGTWELSAPGAPTVRLLQTYAADGTMVSIGDDHPSRSPQMGVWSEVGDRQFLMRNASFRFDPSGAIIRRIDVRVLFTVDPSGHSMTGRGERYEQDAAGASLGPAITFQVQGTRMQPVPLTGR
jgi:hypothetical protein